VAPDSIRAGLLAFFAGDALGVPWEGEPPSRIARDRLGELPERDGFPRGSTSDDSDQTLLVARELVRSGGDPDPERFLRSLADAIATMRGAGPTTKAAVERWRSSGTVSAGEEGATNGAAMRALPIGWATAPAEAERRRSLVELFTRTTHGDPRALAAASAVAAMGSYAVARAPMFSVFAAGLEEAAAVVGDAREVLTKAAVGGWEAPAGGVPFDSLPTVAAVVSVLCGGGNASPGDTMRAAVALGGDTDTVAALAGGVAATRTGSLDGVDWLSEVDAPADDDEVAELADELAKLRD
jgi:ADP-ribosylglycohydrolase